MALDYTDEPWVRALQLQRDDLTAALKAANKRAEAAEARAAELERVLDNAKIPCDTCGGSGFSKPGSGYDAVCDDCTGGYVGYATGDMISDLEAQLAGAAQVVVKMTAECNEWKRRFALNEHVAADLRNIRGLLKATDDVNTFDAVGAVMRERDEARRELEQAHDWIKALDFIGIDSSNRYDYRSRVRHDAIVIMP